MSKNKATLKKKQVEDSKSESPFNYYALGRFRDAVYFLATEPGHVRSRLCSAFNCFHMLKSYMLPVEVQSDFEWVMQQLTKYSPECKGQGSVCATLDRIRNSTGVNIAKRIVQIHEAILTLSLAEREPMPKGG